MFYDMYESKLGVQVTQKSFRPISQGDVSQVTSNLYLGSYEEGALMIQSLRNIGITHILTMGHKMPRGFPEEFSYKVIEFEDSPDVDISVYFDDAYDFICKAFASSKSNKVLVHCWAGISRSATTVMMYLMKSMSMTYVEAYEHVRKARFWVRPNKGFREKLKSLGELMGLGSSKKSAAYERVVSMLLSANNKNHIDAKQAMVIINVFEKVFGKLHQNTLDVKIELETLLNNTQY